ncbi:pyruvate-flavodoxin oxidoreductase [Planctomycetales bacterium]|nr:pyruvate-flavodoxin oxidoreductase [Planctomycetales bacterium]GHS97796.1 pyruvate-flavodoxin oxidoreductase [Planctomycetales bacterium]GHT05794.1 pyruvate-flavodoxin oxidoreductase [Planctomycetales bacterium]GHV21617.1 pyruvate-flavodoxin oxidoreductase [Planctomycetales bacterium]
MSRKMQTMDGNNAAGHVSYAFTEIAAIYPITPSSVMAEVTDTWSAGGRKNIFGDPVKLVEMQSEAGAAGAVHGSLTAGALTTTYTASQGLLLMIPNMYKIAGELLPSVIHVSARALASHALSIFGDHSDVYACRQTGYAMLCATNPQEVMDLGAVAHLATLRARVPFLHFFDGFRTSHEIQKIAIWDYETLAKLVDKDAIQAFRDRALNPHHPVLRGTAQNPDIFFQAREACNKYYDATPAIVQEEMNKINREIGTDYKLFNYYGAPDAEHVIVAMGSAADTIEETIDYLRARGEKVGLLKVRLYRPFAVDAFISALPYTAKQITVLDRTKEPGSLGEPLYLDVVAALRQANRFTHVPVASGRYGLGSKDFNPADVIAIYRNKGKMRFTSGIEDDVTNLSLTITENPDTAAEGTTSCKFWGLGSDGTVGANKNSIKIIGDHTDKYAQAYFAYDSKKSGGITVSHLRFGKSPIKSTYFISKAQFVACHNPSYIDKYDMVQDLVPGGAFLLNCQWDEKELAARLPANVKRYIAKNNINFYIIDAIDIARKIGLGNRVSTVLQSAFFTIANIIPAAEALKYMKDAATKSFKKKGDDVVKMNHDAIDAGAQAAKKISVPAEWATVSDDAGAPKITGDRQELVDFVKNIQQPVNAQKGDKLPVSTFVGMADGTFPQGSAAYEKRGIAVDVPEWQADKCIQCNQCSLVCPHAVIRPLVLNDAEVAAAPQGLKTKDTMQLPGTKYTMAVSVLDCSGCGACANTCIAKEKALVMQPIDSQRDQQAVFDYLVSKAVSDKPEVHEKFKETTVKGSQFKQPLLEFSGACQGCGETPYAKLMTQLFGDRMYIANATGCSSIWAGSAPSTPYTVNKCGRGPAWANSLFEDNAEFGLGMFLAQDALRARAQGILQTIAGGNAPDAIKALVKEYFDTDKDGKANNAAACKLVKAIEALDCDCPTRAELLKLKAYIGKKSNWILGGDGWAYDIGYGGLDHVLASGKNVNVLVFDTEVYSNTGGQASKSTNIGAIAQFAAAGKDVKKKDLAGIAMQYGYVYVAQVAMGADQNQCLKAFAEAEAYDGPSLIIAYAPCINHGIKGGLTVAQKVEKDAVAAGYWHLFRFNPALIAEGKTPFSLDSKAPSASYEEFIMREVRYNSLMRANPDRAKELFATATKNAAKRYEGLAGLVEYYKKEYETAPTA